MRKTILFFVAFVLTMTGAKAQSALVATLSQNGTVSQYYGATALQEAYEAAEDGAVITLSSGTFNAVDINKAITLRGAGCIEDTHTLIVPTYLSGSFTITPTTDDNYFYMEGIYCIDYVHVYGVNNNLKELYISKCFFNGSVSVNMCYPHLTQCFFRNSLGCGQAGSWSNQITRTTCDNCFAYNANDGSGSFIDSKVVFNNCTLIKVNSRNSTFHNCIIISPYYALSGDNTVNNCVGTSSDNSPMPNMFANFPNNSNVYVEDITQLFKTFVWTGSTNDLKGNELYELTETAAATYLGSDGTQVGIYGGSYPFSIAPSNPQVKKFTVSNTTDGDKLKVKINVE